LAQEPIHAVQQIRPHHGNLVDDDRPQLPIEILGAVLELFPDRGGCDVRLEAEEGMDRLAPHVDCGHARRREDDDGLLRGLAEVAEERGFPRARPPRDEDVPVRLLHQLQGLLELGIQVDLLGR